MSHPLLNQPAPTITLPSTPSSSPTTLPIGDKPIALFFFPKAYTTGCTKEACAFRDAMPTFGGDIAVFGVSGDPIPRLTSFADEHKLGYPLLSDADGKARKAFSVSKAAFGLIEGRETFFIDKEGIVRDVCTDMVKWNNHTKMVEKNLKRLSSSK